MFARTQSSHLFSGLAGAIFRRPKWKTPVRSGIVRRQTRRAIRQDVSPPVKWVSMDEKIIFTFWEPRDRIIPYIRLCMKTWEKNLPDFKIVILDYSNLDRFIDARVYDGDALAAIRRFPLSVQKDAFQVSILKKYGGIFMDADTLVLRDVTPLLDRLRRTEILMFRTHLGFVAARADALLFTPWMEEIQNKLRLLQAGKIPDAEMTWDFWGNQILHSLLDRMLEPSFVRIVPSPDRIEQTPSPSRLLLKTMYWLSAPSAKVRWKIFVERMYKRYVTMLDREKYGFIAESRYGGSTKWSDRERYLNFWFTNQVKTVDAFQANPMVIGLHNSWTPSWYQALSEKEVLEHPCLLSRVIRRILHTK